MYDMKALYQAESVQDAVAPGGPSGCPDHRWRIRRAGADAGGNGPGWS